MNDSVHFEQVPPKSWEQFEELCADTFQEEFQDYALVRNGRQGQAQDGVDIVARQGVLWPIGIQCKKKARWPVAKVSTADLDQEVEKAKKFTPPLKAFYLVSTAPDDAPLLAHVRALNTHHRKLGLFEVVVMGWDELVRRTTKHHAVAAKHFGSYSSGPASPLLAAWQAKDHKLLLKERELGIAIREVLHDFADFPAGRILVRQQESEDLLFTIKQRQAATKRSLDEREAILELRDRLRRLRDSETRAVDGLKMLFGHKVLRIYMAYVWTRHASLFVRSFVEQELNPHFSDVTGLEKMRVFPPGLGDEESVAVFMPGSHILMIDRHRADLRQKYPRLKTDNVSELPNQVQFQWAMPALMRKWLNVIEKGASADWLESRGWFDTAAWRISY